MASLLHRAAIKEQWTNEVLQFVTISSCNAAEVRVRQGADWCHHKCHASALTPCFTGNQYSNNCSVVASGGYFITVANNR